MKTIFSKIFVPIIVVLVIGIVLVNVSNGAKPGDLMYGVDRMIERIDMAITNIRGDIATAKKYIAFADERLTEANDILGNVSDTISLVPKVSAQSDSNTLSDEEKEIVEKLLSEYGENMDSAVEIVVEIQSEATDSNNEKEIDEMEEVIEEVAISIEDNQAALTEILEVAPEEMEEIVIETLETSEEQFTEVVEDVSEDLKEDLEESHEEITDLVEESIGEAALDSAETDNDSYLPGDRVGFTGVLKDYSNGCTFDDECYAIVGDYKIITNPGLTPDAVEIGTNEVNTANTGENVEVEAIFVEEGVLTLVGDSTTYIKLAD